VKVILENYETLLKICMTHLSTSFVLVCSLLKKIFELMLQIWKVGTSFVHVVLVLKKYSLGDFLCFDMWFAEKYF